MEIDKLVLPDWVSSDRFSQFQQPYVDEILARFEEGNQLVVVDAPVGSGKSLIAEAVRLELGVPSSYLTHAKVLQDQLERDFSDRAVTIKGKSNYLPVYAEPDQNGDVPTCADCQAERPTDLCEFCPSWEECTYRVRKQLAEEAPVAVSNYAYFFGETRSKKSILRRPLIVADEADSLEGELLNHVSINISPGFQRFLRIRPPEQKTKMDSWERWFEYAIPKVQEVLRVLPKRDLKQKRRHRQVEELLDKMQMIALDLAGWIYDYSGKKHEDYIAFKPIKVNRLAPQILWENGKKWLAMSATIISPEEFVDSLGFEGPWASVFVPSYFPKENRPINYVPVASVTKKTEQTAWPKLAEAVESLLIDRPDRVLIHSQSYALTKYLFDALVHLSREVVCYTNARERDEAIELFEATPGAVLIAPSLERGYDGKDDLVRTVIVCKLARPYLGDKQVSARLYSHGGQLWYDTVTARSLVQQTGRGVRHETDFAETIILDAEFEKFYRKWSTNGDGLSRNAARQHRLFPDWFVEAIDWSSDAKFALREKLRNKGVTQAPREEVSATTST